MKGMSAVWTVAHLTLSEARRRRVAAAAVLCGAAFLAVYTVGVFFAYDEMVNNNQDHSFVERQSVLTFLTVAGLYATNFLSVLFAVLLPVDTMSGEIESGIMQTLASKPVRRGEIVLGKWLGHGLIVTGYLLMLSGGVVLAMRVISGFAPVNLELALPLMLLELLLLMTVSIAGGTRLTTVTNGVMALGFYGVAFVGGWLELVGTYGRIESLETVGVVASLISPPDAMWRLASYHLQPGIVRDLAPAIFTTASPATPLMVWWAAGFMIVTLAWAIRSFNQRAL
jgi:Cu-processing system permease protein